MGEIGMNFTASEAEGLREKRRTLGDMSVLELLESARNEVWGLEKYCLGQGLDVNKPLFKAYMGSILSRILCCRNQARRLIDGRHKQQMRCLWRLDYCRTEASHRNL